AGSLRLPAPRAMRSPAGCAPASRNERAARSIQAVAVTGGEGVQALLDRASRLQRTGRIVEAIGAYEHLLALRPDLAESWYNLGWLRRQARLFEESLAAYEQALERGVSSPEEAHLNRGVILADHLGRPAD